VGLQDFGFALRTVDVKKLCSLIPSLPFRITIAPISEKYSLYHGSPFHTTFLMTQMVMSFLCLTQVMGVSMPWYLTVMAATFLPTITDYILLPAEKKYTSLFDFFIISWIPKILTWYLEIKFLYLKIDNGFADLCFVLLFIIQAIGFYNLSVLIIKNLYVNIALAAISSGTLSILLFTFSNLQYKNTTLYTKINNTFRYYYNFSIKFFGLSYLFNYVHAYIGLSSSMKNFILLEYMTILTIFFFDVIEHYQKVRHCYIPSTHSHSIRVSRDDCKIFKEIINFKMWLLSFILINTVNWIFTIPDLSTMFMIFAFLHLFAYFIVIRFYKLFFPEITYVIFNYQKIQKSLKNY
jgi:hypothetical protein